LVQQLLGDLPAEPETRVVNLAAVAIGVFRSRSLQVGQVVARSPLEASRDTLKKWVQRFLKNPGVQVEVFQRPLAQRILEQIVAEGRQLLLILDRTEWDSFNILYVSVGWRGRALPLMWQMLGPGASSFDQQREVLGIVAGWLPEGAEVLLLGDREFGSGVLASGLWVRAGVSACGCGPRSMCAGKGLKPSKCCQPCAQGSAVSGRR
jgi:hypothetical protein